MSTETAVIQVRKENSGGFFDIGKRQLVNISIDLSEINEAQRLEIVKLFSDIAQLVSDAYPKTWVARNQAATDALDPLKAHRLELLGGRDFAEQLKNK